MVAGSLHPPHQWSAVTRICRSVNGLVILFIACWFFLAPAVLTISNLADPAFRGKEIPRLAWRTHRRLTPRYAAWARERVASSVAGKLSLYDVPSTEWPIFGSVFYLWATEQLQDAWEKDRSLAPVAPAEYARDAAEACVELVLDPVHHTWVRQHWGTNYMHRQNVFFRSLVISALTSYQKLTGNTQHRELLLDQVDSLSAELDASPHGVLEDYPEECYPIDVFCSVACIQRADRVLGTDHGTFIRRSIRGFDGNMLDACGLWPYSVEAQTGVQYEPSRGVGNSYVLIFAPELWPDRAAQWYDRYEQHFWQRKWWAAGFREFPRGWPDAEWTYDVDAGPVIAGYSPAANAFGVAASKVNGRLDHHFTLVSQVLAACWPLPDGTFLGCRILSNAAHAPHLGEACMLFFLTQRPAEGTQIRTGGFIPAFAWLVILFWIAVGVLLPVITVRTWLASRRDRTSAAVPIPAVQCTIWAAIMVVAVGLAIGQLTAYAFLALLVAQFLPRNRL